MSELLGVGLAAVCFRHTEETVIRDRVRGRVEERRREGGRKGGSKRKRSREGDVGGEERKRRGIFLPSLTES